MNNIEQLNDIFKEENFLKNYNEYLKSDEVTQLKNFLDNIELNKKYFRLEMNNKKGYKNKNVSDDTIVLKEINSLLNKVSDKNIDSVHQKIKDKIIEKDYLKEMIIESILNKCIVHTPYISLYLDLINRLYDNSNNTIINKLTDKIYNEIENLEIKAETDYLIMCERNKKLDKQIGHSLLITELEKKKIITGKIHPSIEKFIDILSQSENNEEIKYKCVQCLYNILKSYYEEYILPEGYNLKIKTLIEKEKISKIKFKMMDIIERR